MNRVADVDPEALLVALVLDPATYSRNRFFELYRRSEILHTRRRAMQLRSIVGQVARATRGHEPGSLNLRPARGGMTELTYTVPSLALRRTAVLDNLELCLMRVAFGRTHALGMGVHDPALSPSPEDMQRIQAILVRLTPPSAERALDRASSLSDAP